MNRCSQIGEVGVHLVLAELIGRGFIPYRPAVDDHGVDIMLSNGNRIQVKASSLHRNPSTHVKGRMLDSWRYRFSLIRNAAYSTNGERKKYRLRDLSMEADFVIFVGLDEKRFWIVPTFKLQGCSGIAIPQRGREWKAKPEYDNAYPQIVREYEDCWDIMTQKAITLEDVHSAIESIESVNQSAGDISK